MDILKTGRRAAGAWLCALAAGAAGRTAGAGIIWDESIHGELADLNRYGHPDPAQRGTFTNLGPLTPGVNRVIGRSVRDLGGAVDGDAVRIVVAPDARLTEVIFTHDRGAGLREIFRLTGAAAGPYFMSRAYPPVQLPAGVQDLVTLYGPAEGFDPGAYVFSWENAASGTTMNYTIDFVIVPAPGATGGILVAAALACRPRRRRPGIAQAGRPVAAQRSTRSQKRSSSSSVV